ncbi:MAG: hypothetical protein OEV64_14330 [Desulfobulbaceae bacterium]|nr:hypothetical protein [Desulfobulbaceae bacterium]
MDGISIKFPVSAIRSTISSMGGSHRLISAQFIAKKQLLGNYPAAPHRFVWV